MTPDDLAAIAARHQPAIWHDDQWGLCDADHPDACCRECESFWPCDAARLAEALAEAQAERNQVLLDCTFADANTARERARADAAEAGQAALVEALRREHSNGPGGKNTPKGCAPVTSSTINSTVGTQGGTGAISDVQLVTFSPTSTPPPRSVTSA